MQLRESHDARKVVSEITCSAQATSWCAVETCWLMLWRRLGNAPEGTCSSVLLDSGFLLHSRSAWPIFLCYPQLTSRQGIAWYKLRLLRGWSWSLTEQDRLIHSLLSGWGHWVWCCKQVLLLSIGFNCNFCITWPDACSFALVGPCSAENCRLLLLNRDINYLHYLHIATYWLQHCKVPY